MIRGQRRIVGWAGALAVLALAGCSKLDTYCNKDSDCTAAAGGYCDPQLQACLYGKADGGPVLLDWTSPQDGAFVNGAVTLTAAVLNAAPGTLPPALTYSATAADGGTSSGTLAAQGNGSFAATWSPSGEGTYTFVASASVPDSGTLTSAPLRLTVDQTPPVISVAVLRSTQPRGTIGATDYDDPAAGYSGTSAFHRDEVGTVRVTSDSADVDAAQLAVSVLGADGLDAGTLSGGIACDGGTFCRDIPIDFSKPGLPAFHGQFVVSASAKDIAGNPSNVKTANVNVTRWKWSFDDGFGGTPQAITVTPAVGHRGQVYFATSGAVGSLFAVSPDGVQQWAVDTGSVTTAPAVGTAPDGGDAVYVGQVDPGNSAKQGIALYLSDGGLDSSGVDCFSTATSVASSLSVVPASGGNPETAMTVVSGGSTPVLLAKNTGCIPSGFGGATPSGALAGDGTALFYGTDTGGQVATYTFAAGAWSGGWAASLGITVPSVAITDAGVIGGGTGNSATSEGGLFALVEADGGVSSTYPQTFPSAGFGLVGDAIVGEGGQLFVGVTKADAGTGTPENRLVQADIGKSNSTYQVTSVTGAPVLGADGLVYSVSPSGTLSAFKGSALTPVWSGSVASGTVSASPNLDCSRDASGAILKGRPGVLYIPTSNGKLYAVVVDSPGIDVNASWPKYLHDPRNTSNAQTNLSEFSCQ